MKRKYRVRFNLGKGSRYRKWKIEFDGKTLVYIEPNDVTLIMENCKLVNHQSTAEKIYKGANKTVCAWVECEHLSLREPISIGGEHVSYNPRAAPNWVFQGENVDGEIFAMIRTKGRELLTE
jgi:hypothetical protein